MELAELDDGDQCVLGPLGGLCVGDGDLVPFGITRDCDVRGLRLLGDTGVRTGPRTHDVSEREPADGHHDGQ